ncbi:hypothetical protein BT63DRAFT_440211 [Microthyrium microscopicum]|uniref:Uncharacterized protein n=1 Tax=Microthyrium microscopicum TaxID=703497 RepID=A0A6A6UDW5_9PEZI|nr:hypothetical protein BT63DRAFT_440211 [Microthyrium microscopicum]
MSSSSTNYVPAAEPASHATSLQDLMLQMSYLESSCIAYHAPPNTGSSSWLFRYCSAYEETQMQDDSPQEPKAPKPWPRDCPLCQERACHLLCPYMKASIKRQKDIQDQEASQDQKAVQDQGEAQGQEEVQDPQAKQHFVEDDGEKN